MNKKHIPLILGAIVVCALIYFAPKTALEEEEREVVPKNESSFDFASYIDSLKSGMPPSAKEQLEGAEAYAEGNVENLDSVIRLWDTFRKPLASAYYSQKKAEEMKNSEQWFNSGDRFLTASRILQEANLKKVTYENAIYSFEKALELDPKNYDAKSGLGVAYVESAQVMGNPPMKGIGLLKEVLTEDSTNINALINLGYYSLQSGQFDLAIQRFEKVLEVDPQFHEAYLYLSEIYTRQDNTEKAISYLELYRDNLDNPKMAEEIDRYIEELKTN